MRLLKQRALFFFALFYGAGVITGYILRPSAVIPFCAACAAGIIAAFFAVLSGKRRICASIGAIIFLCAVSLAGASYVSAKIHARPQFDDSYNISFSGRLSGQPYTDEEGARYVGNITDAVINGTEIPCDLRIYLRGENEEVALLGSGMEISGAGHAFMGDTSTNPHEFDFASYLWREGLGGYIATDLDKVTVSGTPGGFAHSLFTLRRSIGQRIDGAFGENSDLVRALVIADRRDMDDDIRKDFSDAGIAHLLAISGLHITIIAAIVSFVLSPIFGRLAASLVTLLIVLAYGVLIGFSPSVTRACIMYAALCAAPIAGRPTDATTRLSQAFLITLLINPLDVGDPGFVLSFTASAGIIWLNDPLCRLLQLYNLDENSFFQRLLKKTLSGFCVTIAAQLATYPAVALFYGTLPVLSVFTNLLVAPFSMVILLACYLGTAIPATAFIGNFLLDSLLFLVEACASISWAVVDVPAPPLWLWIGFFAIGLAVCGISPVPNGIKQYFIPVMPILAAIAFAVTPLSGLKMVFLDVDQADCAVIQTEDRNYIIDLGNNGSEARDYVRGEELSINAIFLTHPHADHAGGLGEFIEEFPVSTVFVPVGWFEGIESKSIAEECTEAAEAGTEFIEVPVGSTMQLSKNCAVTFTEAADGTGDVLNDMSLVMHIEYGESDALFTGDAKAVNAPDIDVLKVGHHGSASATDEILLSQTTPEIAIISSGEGNSYGHPHESVLEMLKNAGAEVYRTDKSGAITVYMDEHGKIKVDTFR